MEGAGGSTRRERWYLVELLGMTAVTVAQPVYNVVQQAPEELVSVGAGPAEIVVYALIVLLGPPLLLWALEQPVRLLGPTVRDRVHAGILGLGVGLFVIEVVKSGLLDAEGRRWLIAVGLVVAVGAGYLLARSAKARSAVRYLALAAPVFLGLFLFASPVADLVVSDGVDAAEVEVGNPVPVVLVTFDEFPLVSLLDGEGRIDADSYPSFAELAGDSTWFRNNTGVAPLTPAAVPAILTGQLPTEAYPAPVAARFDESLFTLLGATYDVRSVETLTELCPPGVCGEREGSSFPTVVRALVDEGVEVFGSLAEPWADQATVGFVNEQNPSDAQAAERFVAFGHSIIPGDRPTLDFAHLLLPHQPWDWLASGRTYEAPDPPRSVESGVWFDQTTADQGRQRHLVQLRYTDHLLGEVLDDLRARGVYDEALVIVTADHGAGFVGGEPLRGVSEGNYHEVMWTPLFVKEPGQSDGVVDDRPTETIDIVPTIADVLEVDLPWETDGTSVFAEGGEGDDRPARMIDWRWNTAEADGRFVELDRADGFALVLEGSNPAAGHGDDPDAVLRHGEYGDLVGTLVEDADAGDPTGIEAMTAAAPGFTVAEGATEVPAYVDGVWLGESPGWIAVAIDGTVAGVAQSYPAGEYATFWALLAERLLTAGEHELSFHVVSGPADDPTLSPMEMVPPG